RGQVVRASLPLPDGTDLRILRLPRPAHELRQQQAVKLKPKGRELTDCCQAPPPDRPEVLGRVPLGHLAAALLQIVMEPSLLVVPDRGADRPLVRRSVASLQDHPHPLADGELWLGSVHATRPPGPNDKRTGRRGDQSRPSIPAGTQEWKTRRSGAAAG